jgi:Dehydrogenases with different specificities (related to short-chain alcohol dehydrogenases)
MSILVTGGSSGLGEAITRRLAGQKDETIFFTFCKSSGNAKALESELPNTKGIKCNFNNADDLTALNNFILSSDLSVLINNAFTGRITPEHFHKTDAAVFKDNFISNVMPVIQITQSAIKVFRKKKYGKIITILTSFIANKPPVGLSEYVAQKAYLESLSKSWAAENIKYNITSNSISPSFLKTALNAGVDERIVENITAENPLKKLLTIDEVAEAVLFLSNATQQINGINLLMNAGSDVI